jgi:hypothetical protein
MYRIIVPVFLVRCASCRGPYGGTGMQGGLRCGAYGTVLLGMVYGAVHSTRGLSPAAVLWLYIFSVVFFGGSTLLAGWRRIKRP